MFSDTFAYSNGPVVGASGSPWQHLGSFTDAALVTSNALELLQTKDDDVMAPLSGAPYSTGMLTVTFDLRCNEAPDFFFPNEDFCCLWDTATSSRRAGLVIFRGDEGFSLQIENSPQSGTSPSVQNLQTGIPHNVRMTWDFDSRRTTLSVNGGNAVVDKYTTGIGAVALNRFLFSQTDNIGRLSIDNVVVQHHAQPANDSFSNATLISGAAGAISDANRRATMQTSSSEPAVVNGIASSSSVWYRWVAPSTGKFTFRLDGEFDSQLAVYSGSTVGSLTSLGGSDAEGIRPEQVTVSTTSGTTLRIRVSSWNAAAGNFDLSWGSAPTLASFPGIPLSIAPHQSFDSFDEFDDEKAAVFTLDRKSITFYPDPVDGYTYVVHPIERFPVDMSQVAETPYDPDEEDPDNEPDDEEDEFTITLPPGVSLPYFNTTYTSFAVDQEGYIRFAGSPDDEVKHLEKKEIAVFRSSGFGYRARVLHAADKVVVQFDGIRWSPESAKELFTNAAQAELFHDGRIRLSYFSNGVGAAMVGLSNGSPSLPAQPQEEDFASRQIAASASPGVEGSASAVVKVSLSADLAVPASFGYRTVSGTARAGEDFTAISGSTTIAAGQSSASLTIAITNDTASEADESLILELHHPAHPEWSYGSTRVWIIDNDAAPATLGGLGDPAPRMRLDGTRIVIEPGGTTTTQFRIVSIQGGGLSDPATGANLSAGSLISLAQALAGLTTSGPDVAVTVEALGAGSTVLASSSIDVQGEAAGTSFNFETALVEASEGWSAELTVRATGPSRAIAYEIVPGTATPHNGTQGDYLAQLVPLAFAGDIARIEIPLISDERTDDLEHFHVRLVTAGAGNTLGSESYAKVIIRDGEGPVREPLAARAAAATAAELPFWPGDIYGSLGFLENVPGTPEISSGSSTVNFPIPEQRGKFRVTYKVRVTGSDFDALMGLSENTPVNYAEMSALVRANDDIWDAYDDVDDVENGPADFTTDGDIAAVAGTTYSVSMDVDVAARRYDVWIDGVQVLDQGSFRHNAEAIRYLSLKKETGSIHVSDIEVFPRITSIPFAAQSGEFTVEFDLRLSGDAEFDSGFSVGLSNGPVATYTNLAAELFTGSFGNFDYSIWQAWTEGPPAMEVPSDLEIQRGQAYHIRFDVNVPAGSFQVAVTPLRGDLENDGSAIDKLFPDTSWGKFRGNPSSLDHLNFFTGSVAAKVTNLKIPPRATSIPATAPVSANWIHIPIPRQKGKFSISYDIQASASPMDGLAGLAATKILDWNDLAVFTRANPQGFWDGWKNGTFARTTDLGYQVNKLYHVTLDVDVVAGTYNATIAPHGGVPVLVLNQGTFRKDVDEICYLVVRSVTGAITVNNISEPYAHPTEAHRQTVGQVVSKLGTGSGVAVADHAVLTAGRLVFDGVNFAFPTNTVWKFRYQTCAPSNVFLTTSYSAALLSQRPAGDVTGDSSDVAVLAFRPTTTPELGNAPALGGYSGFIMDPNANPGSHPSLAAGITRMISYFPAATAPFIFENPSLTNITATSTSFSHSGRGVHTAGSLSTAAGAQGAPLFALHSNGRYYPCAVYLPTPGSTPRVRAIDALVAHTIYRANMVQQVYDYGSVILHSATEWDPNAVDDSILASYALVSGELLPPTATWQIRATRGELQNQSTTSSGGKALSMISGDYEITLGPAAGYTIVGTGKKTVTLFNGDKYLIPKSSYKLAPVMATYQTWAAGYFTTLQLTTSAAAATSVGWSGVDNLTAYAFGLDPNVANIRPCNLTTNTPGLPLIRVNTATSPPTFQVDFLQRISSDLLYTVEFSDHLAGPWLPSSTAPVLTSISGNTEWKRASLTTAPAAPGTRKFARVKAILATP